MKKIQLTAILCAVLCAASVMTACSSERADSSVSQAEEESQTTTAEGAETTTAAEETTAMQTETTSAEEEADTTTAPPAEEDTPGITTNANKTDSDSKILWSERGLEAKSIHSLDGYGVELKVDEQYLGWNLDAFDGILSNDATRVDEMFADFTYAEGTLAANGIITVYSKDDPDHPNGMSLRVDNQADFPYFPQDSRERGRFYIENTRDAFAMLGIEETTVSEQYEIAVSVSVSKLHIHLAPNGFDTIRITAASRR
ncbi:MAG: hypothetical protein MJ071_01500 [Oscillospiraceae bacterium]|nr:hypothetical protein [Oscillospiraceae bacterium]